MIAGYAAPRPLCRCWVRRIPSDDENLFGLASLSPPTGHRPALCGKTRAAVTLGWSNGQAEGQINRLKTSKRQMYGRAGLDRLERRFLLAA
jgi:hypothetical protein